MRLELLALLLGNENTAVAQFGLRDGADLTPMFKVPFAYDEVTTEKVLGAMAGLQAKLDTLHGIYEACQPKLIAASGPLPANVTPGTFGKKERVN